MPLDILITSIALIFFEKKIVGRKRYLPFSPFFVFIASYNLLFIAPTVLSYSLGVTGFYSVDAETNAGIDYWMFNRLFFYFFVIIFFSSFYFGKNKSIELKKCKLERVGIVTIFFVLGLGVVAKIIYLGVGLGFNPSMMIQRLLFPREFTYIKSGTGFINYLQNSLILLSYFLSVVYLKQNDKSKIAVLLVAFTACLYFVGGAKQQLLWLAFIYVMINLKLSTVVVFNVFRNIKYVLAISILVVFAFMLMVVRADDRSLLARLIDYQRESYYSSLVIRDFSWEFEYLYTAISDTFLAIIPRFVWGEKPLLGLYNRYWREMYESSTVDYHTSTYGFIAEAFMMFGWFGPFLYAFVFWFLVSFCYKTLLNQVSIYRIFTSIYLTTLFYFFLRTGFTGFSLINVLFTLAVARFLLKRNFVVR